MLDSIFNESLESMTRPRPLLKCFVVLKLVLPMINRYAKFEDHATFIRFKDMKDDPKFANRGGLNWLGHSRSSAVPAFHRALAIVTTSFLHRLQNMAIYWLKIANFTNPICRPQLGNSCWGILSRCLMLENQGPCTLQKTAVS